MRIKEAAQNILDGEPITEAAYDLIEAHMEEHKIDPADFTNELRRLVGQEKIKVWSYDLNQFIEVYENE